MKITRPDHFYRDGLYYVNSSRKIRIRTALINNKVAMNYLGNNPWRFFTLDEYEDILALLNFI